jgi:hypothetical protein
MVGLSAESNLDLLMLPRNGIKFPQQLPYEKWLSIGRQLSTVGSSSAWCLGDWLVHGELAYTGRYRDAVEQTSLDYQTLRNYAWVARRFEMSRRRDKLSFGHHAEVASLPAPEQDFWLRKAEEQSWSRNGLRREVRASLAERSVPREQLSTDAADGNDPYGDEANKYADGTSLFQEERAANCQIKIELSLEQLECCRVAAERTGRTLQEWAALVLDRVARDGLAVGINRGPAE